MRRNPPSDTKSWTGTFFYLLLTYSCWYRVKLLSQHPPLVQVQYSPLQLLWLVLQISNTQMLHKKVSHFSSLFMIMSKRISKLTSSISVKKELNQSLYLFFFFCVWLGCCFIDISKTYLLLVQCTYISKFTLKKKMYFSQNRWFYVEH